MALLPLLALMVLSISGTRIVNRDSRPCRGAISQFLAVHSTMMHGPIYSYTASYDWRKGTENHSPATAKSSIFLHLPQDNEVKAKPRLEQPAANDIRKLQTEEHSGEG